LHLQAKVLLVGRNASIAYIDGGLKHKNPPVFDTEGLYEVKASTKAGGLDPAFLVYKWDSDTSNTLIFHHGASEYPFYWIFSNIFKKEMKVAMTLTSNRTIADIKPDALVDLSKL